MSEEKAGRTCQFCKKIFCCVECRDRHVGKLHPGVRSDCPLCSYNTFPVRQFQFGKLASEDEQLLCHVVDKHLPLHCKLCGDLFQTREDFELFGTCKWYVQRRQSLLAKILPGTPAATGLENKLKLRSISDAFLTPPEIYRNTSTPMFGSQKNDFEYQTPSMPNFSLKTPKTNSPSIGPSNAVSKTQETCDSDARFFSFSATSEITPYKPEFSRSNSGRKLDVMNEQINADESTDVEAKKMIANEDRVMSPVDMDLTNTEAGVLRDSPRYGILQEETSRSSDVVKKVRFSDQYDTLPKIEDKIQSYARSSLNAIELSQENEEEFHDAEDSIIDMKKTKRTNRTDMAKATKDTIDTEYAIDGRVEFKTSLSDVLDKPQPSCFEDNAEDSDKENQDPKGRNMPAMNPQKSSKVLLMVLVQNNGDRLGNDVMPMIDTGLKKLEEQIESANCQLPSITDEHPGIPDPANYRRQSIAKLQMSVSSIESYSLKNGATMTNHRQTSPSSSSSSSAAPSSNGNGSSGGILATVAQAVRYALRNLSGTNIAKTYLDHQRENKESSQEAFSGSSSGHVSTSSIRPGKRTRDVTEVSSRTDSVTLPMDGRSPLAKRQRGWYRIKGREPISRMRNNLMTSPRGISSETQVFSQGSLTVGDTVLPLPARAHQSTQTEKDTSIF